MRGHRASPRPSRASSDAARFARPVAAAVGKPRQSECGQNATASDDSCRHALIRHRDDLKTYQGTAGASASASKSTSISRRARPAATAPVPQAALVGRAGKAGELPPPRGRDRLVKWREASGVGGFCKHCGIASFYPFDAAEWTRSIHRGQRIDARRSIPRSSRRSDRVSRRPARHLAADHREHVISVVRVTCSRLPPMKHCCSSPRSRLATLRRVPRVTGAVDRAADRGVARTLGLRSRARRRARAHSGHRRRGPVRDRVWRTKLAASKVDGGSEAVEQTVLCFVVLALAQSMWPGVFGAPRQTWFVVVPTGSSSSCARRAGLASRAPDTANAFIPVPWRSTIGASRRHAPPTMPASASSGRDLSPLRDATGASHRPSRSAARARSRRRWSRAGSRMWRRSISSAPTAPPARHCSRSPRGPMATTRSCSRSCADEWSRGSGGHQIGAYPIERQLGRGGFRSLHGHRQADARDCEI